jgi:hypothetical protein
MTRLRSKTRANARVSGDHDEKNDAETHEDEIGHGRLLLFFLDGNMVGRASGVNDQNRRRA